MSRQRGGANTDNYIFIDLKNEERARLQLQKFGKRRAYDVAKLAIVKDIEPDSLGIDEEMLNRLISRPFSAMAPSVRQTKKSQPEARAEGFLSSLKQRILG